MAGDGSVSKLSDYLEAALINALLRGVSYSSPVQTYLALHTADPTDTGINEVAVGGYVRKSVAWSSAANGASRNGGAISFPAIGVAATGSITTVAGSLLVDGETFTLDDGTNPAVVFEFDSDASVVETDTLRAVTFTGAETADQIRDLIISAVTGAPTLAITASNGGAATVTLDNDTPGTAGNVVISETVTDAGFVVSGMAGGEDGFGTVSHFGVWDSLSGGNLLFHGPLQFSPTIDLGQSFVVHAGSIQLTLSPLSPPLTWANDGPDNVKPGGRFSSITEDVRNAWLDAVLNGVAFTTPATVYLGILVGDDFRYYPAGIAEVNGPSYARQVITFDAPVDGVTQSAADVVFGPTEVGESWNSGTNELWFLGIFDALSGGNLLVLLGADGTPTDNALALAGFRQSFPISAGNIGLTVA